MAALDMHNSPRCQHVHYNGKPCKAPARRGRNYCVFHQAASLGAGGCVLPIIEDLHSYQLAVIRIMNALADDVIDSKKATALLYGLQLLGGKLKDFVKEREEVENPAAALKKEIEQRYDARRHPFPSWIPEKDVIAILKEMRAEQAAEQRTDAPEPSAPAPVSTCHPERGRADAGGESESRDLHVSPAEPTNQKSRIENQESPEPSVMSPAPAPTTTTSEPAVPKGRLAGSPARSAGNAAPITDRVPEGRTDLTPSDPPTTHHETDNQQLTTGNWQLIRESSAAKRALPHRNA